MDQIVFRSMDKYTNFERYLFDNDIKHILLVCGKILKNHSIVKYFYGLKDTIGLKINIFSDFSPNPQYTSIINGVRLYRNINPDCIVALGGGSAIDVAKCIKLYGNLKMNGENGGFLRKKVIPHNDIRLIAIPTTAGAGSEATGYAVVYYNGKKQSIVNEGIIPDAVLFDDRFLRTLPLYQKKATLFDALCHSIESFWSINSTDESKGYSRESIRLIIENIDPYIEGAADRNSCMQQAAYIAGKAIGITQTTAGHAMSYGLTSRFGISHGHAVALCIKELWPEFVTNDSCWIDPRGNKYVETMLKDLAECFGTSDLYESYLRFMVLFNNMGFEVPRGSYRDVEILVKNVNETRLKNHPMNLSLDCIRRMYKRILIEDTASKG